jgi:hypothetical protein
MTRYIKDPVKRERARQKRIAERAASRADLLTRLNEAALKDPEGETGIYAEMRNEMIQRNAK